MNTPRLVSQNMLPSRTTYFAVATPQQTTYTPIYSDVFEAWLSPWMTADHRDQAKRDSQFCRCNDCLCCAVRTAMRQEQVTP